MEAAMQAEAVPRRRRPRGLVERWRRWSGPGRAARWRRGRARRAAAALLVALAAWAALSALAPAPPPTATVLVAARDLPSGATLSGEDLTEHTMPADLVPPGALRPGEPTTSGTPATTVGPLAAGEVLTRSRVLLAGEAPVPAGAAGVFVPLPDPSLAGVLAPGTPVDLVSVADGTRLASGAQVLSLLRDPELGTVSGVLVATSPPEAAAVSAGGLDPLGGGGVSVVLSGPETG